MLIHSSELVPWNLLLTSFTVVNLYPLSVENSCSFIHISELVPSIRWNLLLIRSSKYPSIHWNLVLIRISEYHPSIETCCSFRDVNSYPPSIKLADDA